MAESRGKVQPLIIGRYELHGEIARGGMATVHLGRILSDAGFSRTVAIKRLHPQCAADPAFAAMFVDEARLASRIHHPNVVSTLDVVVSEGELFVVMEYVQGESLSRLQRLQFVKGFVPVELVISVGAGVLDGLHAAHEATSENDEPLGIVHRDVSPQNILVGVDGVPRIIDFGVAKAARRLQTTREGQLKGKLRYMPPEQFAGAPPDRRSDIYATALVLWEALTGKRLFDGETDAESVGKILRGASEPPSLYAPHVSPALDDVVMCGLSGDPTRRFPTAHEMALALEATVTPASPRRVGEWVRSMAADSLSDRAKHILEIESNGSSGVNVKAVLPGVPTRASGASEGPGPLSQVSRTFVPRRRAVREESAVWVEPETDTTIRKSGEPEIDIEPDSEPNLEAVAPSDPAMLSGASTEPPPVSSVEPAVGVARLPAPPPPSKPFVPFNAFAPEPTLAAPPPAHIVEGPRVPPALSPVAGPVGVAAPAIAASPPLAPSMPAHPPASLRASRLSFPALNPSELGDRATPVNAFPIVAPVASLAPAHVPVAAVAPVPVAPVRSQSLSANAPRSVPLPSSPQLVQLPGVPVPLLSVEIPAPPPPSGPVSTMGVAWRETWDGSAWTIDYRPVSPPVVGLFATFVVLVAGIFCVHLGQFGREGVFGLILGLAASGFAILRMVRSTRFRVDASGLAMEIRPSGEKISVPSDRIRMFLVVDDVTRRDPNVFCVHVLLVGTEFQSLDVEFPSDGDARYVAARLNDMLADARGARPPSRSFTEPPAA